MSEKHIYRVLNAAQSGCDNTADIAEQTGLSINHVSACVSELIADGLLHRNGIKRQRKRNSGDFRGGTLRCFEAAKNNRLRANV